MYVIYKVKKSKTLNFFIIWIMYVYNKPVGRSVCHQVNPSGSVIIIFCSIPVKYYFIVSQRYILL